MSTREMDFRRHIVEIGRRMYDNRWVAANDGNISVQLAPNRFLITPTGVSKGMMTCEDLVLVDENGTRVSGDRQPTSEIAVHLVVYRERADIGAVVHAHPPVATGFAVAGRALDLAIVPEVVVNLGAVPLAEYGLPGTSELADTILPLVGAYDAILLSNHGAIAYGPDLASAFAHMDTVEHVARIALVAETLGGARLLERRDVDRLIEARGRYGVSPRPSNSVRPLCREEYENLASHGRDEKPIGKTGLRQYIGSELAARLGSLFQTAGVRVTITRIEPPRPNAAAMAFRQDSKRLH